MNWKLTYFFQPLTDADREPWLASIVASTEDSPEPILVLACSALKEKYRNQLRSGETRRVLFVWPHGSKDVILERMTNRPSHFMNPALIDSQFEALEPPSGTDVLGPLDITMPLENLVDQAMEWLKLLYS